MAYLKVYTDGGARGNPGPSAIAVVIRNEKGDILKTYAERIGSATNNFAEYRAFLKGIELISDFLREKLSENLQVFFHSDSELLVRQLNGKYKVKSKSLKPLFTQALESLKNLKVSYKIIHLEREQNRLADKLLNKVLDAEEKNR